MIVLLNEIILKTSVCLPTKAKYTLSRSQSNVTMVTRNIAHARSMDIAPLNVHSTLHSAGNQKKVEKY